MSRSSARRLSSSSAHHGSGDATPIACEVRGVDVSAHHQPLEPEGLLDASPATACAVGRLGAQRAEAPRHLARRSTRRDRAAPAARADSRTGRRARHGCSQPSSKRASAHGSAPPCAWRAARQLEQLDQLGPLRLLEPVARAARRARTSRAAPSCHGPSSVRHQAVEAERGARPDFSSRSAVTSLRNAIAGLRQRRRLARARLDGQHHERVRLLVLAAGAPDRLGRRVDRDRRAPAPRPSRAPSARRRAPRRQRRHHGVDRGVLVDHRLELAVGALEARHVELEGARRPPTRGPGSARAPPRRDRARRPARSSRPSRAGSRRRPRCAASASSALREARQRPQLGEALAHELVGQRPVAIEHRARAGALGDLERDLGAGLERRADSSCGRRLGERVQLVVQRPVPHGRVVRRMRSPFLRARTRKRGGAYAPPLQSTALLPELPRGRCSRRTCTCPPGR